VDDNVDTGRVDSRFAKRPRQLVVTSAITTRARFIAVDTKSFAVPKTVLAAFVGRAQMHHHDVSAEYAAFKIAVERRQVRRNHAQHAAFARLRLPIAPKLVKVSTSACSGLIRPPARKTLRGRFDDAARAAFSTSVGGPAPHTMLSPGRIIDARSRSSSRISCGIR